MNLKQAIANAILAGCTGGSFFHQDYSWVQFERSSTYSINWDLFPEHVEPHLDPVSSFQELRTRGGLSLWWEYCEDFPSIDTPKWWNASEADVKVCVFLRLHFHSILIYVIRASEFYFGVLRIPSHH